jgi:hypothetical protein
LAWEPGDERRLRSANHRDSVSFVCNTIVTRRRRSLGARYKFATIFVARLCERHTVTRLRYENRNVVACDS